MHPIRGPAPVVHLQDNWWANWYDFIPLCELILIMIFSFGMMMGSEYSSSWSSLNKFTLGCVKSCSRRNDSSAVSYPSEGEPGSPNASLTVSNASFRFGISSLVIFEHILWDNLDDGRWRWASASAAAATASESWFLESVSTWTESTKSGSLAKSASDGLTRRLEQPIFLSLFLSLVSSSPTAVCWHQRKKIHRYPDLVADSEMKRQGKASVSYRNIGEVYIIFPEERHELLKVFSCWKITSTVRPDSLVQNREEKHYQIHLSIKEQTNSHIQTAPRVYIPFSFHTFRTPSSTTNLPADSVATPARKLECWNVPLLFSPIYNALDVLRTKIHFVSFSPPVVWIIFLDCL